MAVDRQSLIFFIIIFIFLTLPNGNDQPHSYQERQTLITLQNQLKQNRETLDSSEYNQGYGNLTGFLLSYDDMIHDKEVLKWPLHDYDKDHPWIEDEKYSVLPNEVSNRVKKFWGNDPVDIENRNSLGYLFNISGKAYGEFEKVKSDSSIKKYSLKLPDYLQKYYNAMKENGQFNQRSDNDNDNDGNDKPDDNSQKTKLGDINFDDGKIHLGIKGYDYNFNNPDLSKFIVNKTTDEVNDAMMINLNINYLDQAEAEVNNLESSGVYFQRTGSIVSISNSGKFMGYPALPHLTMNEDNFDTSKKLVGQFLKSVDVEKQVNMDDMNSFISKSIDECEFINYIQLEKTEYLIQELRDIDEELRNPNGRPISKDYPRIKIKESLLYSPDCGMILSSKNKPSFEGNKNEVTMLKLRTVLVAFLILVACQLYLFVNQIKIAKTPGQLSNISSVTLMLIQYQDSMLALNFLLIATLFENLFLILAGITIITYIMCGIFEMGFLTQVIKTQYNERGTTWWQILRGLSSRNEDNDSSNTSNNNNQSGNGDNEVLPAPVTNGNANNTPGNTNNTPGNTNTNTNTTNTTPVVVNQEANAWNSIFAPGFALTIISTFIELNSFMWRKQYRRIFEIVGLTLLNSYWYPQFFRNTLKNRTNGFLWSFILGLSIIRLIPIVYLNTCPNPFRHDINKPFAIFIVLWVGLQLVLMYLQTLLGPRFWINDKWLPQAYNFHPIITLKDLEKGYASDILNNINLTEANQDNDNDVINCQVDCAICMTSVDLPIHKNGTPKTKTDNHAYMITPCFHAFHSECLEDWMKYKLQCPICRNGLPPV